VERIIADGWTQLQSGSAMGPWLFGEFKVQRSRFNVDETGYFFEL
jgi:hypothetical protein